MKTKKSLGQHWLFDGPSLQAIIDAAELQSTDTVLEIGPGRGPLTDLLSQNAKQVIAVEKDTDLIEGLKVQFILQENVEIIQADIMEFDLREVPKDYVVVANIPYYLTSAIIRLLMESVNPPKKLVLLIQKEVAERITAMPGALSVLAVSVQLYALPEYVATVTKDKFQPPPKIDSAILRLTHLE
nr:ribosomal RNA small subunit methyltransferase A [Candidatus Saccharibacteria bacterium]